MLVRARTVQLTLSQSILLQFVLATLGAGALALLSQVKIPLQPVPVTFQVLGVLLLGGLLGPRCGVLAVVEYLLLGVCGVPVFSGWTCGPAILLGPTGGYLLGFVLAAALYGVIIAQLQAKPYLLRLTGAVLGVLLAVAVIYLPGWAWLAMGPIHLGATTAFTMGILPFAVIDLCKVGVAAAVLTLRK